MESSAVKKMQPRGGCNLLNQRQGENAEWHKLLAVVSGSFQSVEGRINTLEKHRSNAKTNHHHTETENMS